MITEQYVEFETAKLLKEKGFDGDCMFVFNIHSNGILPCGFGTKNSEIDNKNIVTIPSQSLVMRWLREVHHKIIIIHYGNVGHPDEPKLQWWWELLNSKGEFCECNISDGNDTYEQAAESAIKYCLENLI